MDYKMQPWRTPVFTENGGVSSRLCKHKTNHLFATKYKIKKTSVNKINLVRQKKKPTQNSEN